MSIKRLSSIFLFFALVLVGVYFIITIDEGSKNQAVEDSVATFSSKELGIEFVYQTGPLGYVLQEVIPTENDSDFLRSIVLTRTEDAVDVGQVLGGEGPPTITIVVFKNPENQEPKMWADKHPESSNINLKRGDVTEESVGGVNAIRYMADGLYVSENVVAAYGENVYVISGMYLDEESQLRKDFSPLLESVRFIPEAL